MRNRSGIWIEATRPRMRVRGHASGLSSLQSNDHRGSLVALCIEPELGTGVPQVEPGIVVIRSYGCGEQEELTGFSIAAAAEQRDAHIVRRLGVPWTQAQRAAIERLGLRGLAKVEQRQATVAQQIRVLAAQAQ